VPSLTPCRPQSAIAGLMATVTIIARQTTQP